MGINHHFFIGKVLVIVEIITMFNFLSPLSRQPLVFANFCRKLYIWYINKALHLNKCIKMYFKFCVFCFVLNVFVFVAYYYVHIFSLYPTLLFQSLPTLPLTIVFFPLHL